MSDRPTPLPIPEQNVAESLLEVRGLVKRFGRITALDGVGIDVRAGEIHAVLGENGAGKSTLMHVVSGLLSSDAGRIRFARGDARWRSPEQARAAGIAMVHQHFMLVPTMTVGENLALALGVRGWLRADRLAAEVREIATRNGLVLPAADRVVEQLSVGEMQRVEISKALLGTVRLLILDEPTAVLTPEEVAALFALMRALTARGVAVVIVTHKLAEVVEIAECATVLRRGRVVETGLRRPFDERALAALMVGETATPGAAAELPGAAAAVPDELRHGAAAREPLLVARELRARDARGAVALDGVSFEVAAGEILAVAGVEGNGQAELVELLSGVGRQTLREVRGTVQISGAPVSSAASARDAGLAVISPDRRRDGLVAELELWENLLLGRDLLRESAPRRILRRGAALRRAARLLGLYAVRPADPHAVASTLSGGNQQRLIAARELERDHLRAVVAANPTRGLDFGATKAVRARLRSIARAGFAVVVLSTDLDEIIQLGDRIAVLYRGRLIEPRVQPATRAVVGRLMAGGEEAA
jgi:general nucleoside transport system ATP-binding protein